MKARLKAQGARGRIPCPRFLEPYALSLEPS